MEITKRKSSKNMFKSEKEFFELMLKYQRVISERDSGKKLGNQFLLSRPLFYALGSQQVICFFFSALFI